MTPRLNPGRLSSPSHHRERLPVAALQRAWLSLYGLWLSVWCAVGGHLGEAGQSEDSAQASQAGRSAPLLGVHSDCPLEGAWLCPQLPSSATVGYGHPHSLVPAVDVEVSLSGRIDASGECLHRRSLGSWLPIPVCTDLPWTRRRIRSVKPVCTSVALVCADSQILKSADAGGQRCDQFQQRSLRTPHPIRYLHLQWYLLHESESEGFFGARLYHCSAIH